MTLWRTQTARWQHWYYRHPAQPLPKTPSPWKGELQGEGRYVVAPGSLHPEGRRYSALGDWTVPKSALPVFDPQWLIDLEARRRARLRLLTSRGGAASPQKKHPRAQQGGALRTEG